MLKDENDGPLTTTTSDIHRDNAYAILSSGFLIHRQLTLPHLLSKEMSQQTGSQDEKLIKYSCRLVDIHN